MRRIAITGLGIVSAIGNNAAEVTQALRDNRSGITFAADYAERGFRSQVYGKPTLDPAEAVDKRRRRFMGDGAIWNCVALEQAIADAGLEPGQVSHERTGMIMGSGGPVDQEPGARLRHRPREGRAPGGPVHGAAGDVLDQFGDPGDAVPDQGRELFDLLGLCDLCALHRQRLRADPARQAGHRLRRGRGGARLDPVAAV